MTQTYNDHVNEALDDVMHGQHLRFINSLYRTKEVCLAAVKWESTHTYALNDFYSVPMGNLDYVVNEMIKVKKEDQYYLDNMNDEYKKRKDNEQVPGYYGKFKSLLEVLDYYEVTTYDEMSYKKYHSI
jgi:hypothetical protein